MEQNQGRDEEAVFSTVSPTPEKNLGPAVGVSIIPSEEIWRAGAL
jgi:hypothetical protein